MTRKLEELFDMASSDNDETIDTYSKLTLDETKTALIELDNAIDKIDVALPTIKDLDASDNEMDALASLAQEKFQDLMDLGMNVEPRFSGVILQTASQLLGHSITAKTAKMDKKLKMVQLQLQKARLDHQINKDNGGVEDPIEGQGVVIDRSTLLNEILSANKKTSDG